MAKNYNQHSGPFMKHNCSLTDVYTLVTNRIITQLESGAIPWRKPWHGETGGAISYATGKPYSLINQLLLNRGGEFLTFNQCKALGGRVRKGAKSQFIVFFKQIPIQLSATNDNESDTETIKTIPILRYFNVFHISDCEGVPPKFLDAKREFLEPDETAENIINDYVHREGIDLQIRKSDRAFYSPASDRVVCPELEQYDNKDEYYSTIFHELTHSTGAKNRLNREFSGKFGKEPYAREELIAEIGAAYLTRYSGLNCEKSEKNSAAYLQSWIKALQNDHRLIVSAASKAEKAVNYILNIQNSTE